MDAHKLATILQEHEAWILKQPNGEKADLQYANLQYADLQYANLSNLKAIHWQSHVLIGELLWREAKQDIKRKMVAAFIARQIEFCWKDFMKYRHPQKQWVLHTLAQLGKADASRPKILAKYENLKPKKQKAA